MFDLLKKKHYLPFLGRFIGSLIGLRQDDNDLLESFKCTYRGLAIIAAIIAVLYFLLYQLWLAPKCIPPTQVPPTDTLIGKLVKFLVHFKKLPSKILELLGLKVGL